jgi:signal transduction histidine kinase
MQSVKPPPRATARRRARSSAVMTPAASRGRARDRVRETAQLVGGILHEFNTPLGALRSAIETARSSVRRAREQLARDPAQAERVLARVDAVLAIARVATERLVDTVATLSHFARVDRAEVDVAELGELVDTALRLSGVARRAADAARAGDGAGARGSARGGRGGGTEAGPLAVRKDVPAPLRVRCRAREIEHVLYHLLRNANEALEGHAAGRVEVRARRVGNSVTVVVDDNGPGIADAALPTLFEPSLGTKGGTVGLELSLATCRRIAREHGGSLDAENLPAGGARFTFRFRETAAP